MAKTVKLNMCREDLPAMLEALKLCRVGAEVGTHHGYFSYYWLKTSKVALLYSIDSYAGKWADIVHDARARLSEFGKRSILMHGTSVETAKQLLEEYEEAGDHPNFDFVYIDADHREASVKQDIEAWLPLMKRPCAICGHDYLVARKCGVIPAVQFWADKLEVPIYLTRERWTSWFMLLSAE